MCPFFKFCSDTNILILHRDVEISVRKWRIFHICGFSEIYLSVEIPNYFSWFSSSISKPRKKMSYFTVFECRESHIKKLQIFYVFEVIYVLKCPIAHSGFITNFEKNLENVHYSEA